MQTSTALAARDFPERPAPLEEACAAQPRDMAATFAFALARRDPTDARPVLFAAPRGWLSEYGKPHGPGVAGVSLLLTPVSTPVEALWVLEQALRSSAVSLALGSIDRATMTQTRRLDFAARQGQAVGLLLPRALDHVSAAARRWRITTSNSVPEWDDPRGVGRPRMQAELTRSRFERPGRWLLEQDDETHRLRLADRLADLGHASIAGAGAAAGLAA